jgi:hypothetical protein
MARRVGRLDCENRLVLFAWNILELNILPSTMFLRETVCLHSIGNKVNFVTVLFNFNENLGLGVDLVILS